MWAGGKGRGSIREREQAETNERVRTVQVTLASITEALKRNTTSGLRLTSIATFQKQAPQLSRHRCVKLLVSIVNGVSSMVVRRSCCIAATPAAVVPATDTIGRGAEQATRAGRLPGSSCIVAAPAVARAASSNIVLVVLLRGRGSRLPRDTVLLSGRRCY